MKNYIETNRFNLDGCEVVINRPQFDEAEREDVENAISVSLGKVVSDFHKKRGMWDQ